VEVDEGGGRRLVVRTVALAHHRPRLGLVGFRAVRRGEGEPRSGDASHRPGAFGDRLGGGHGVVFGVEEVEERAVEGVPCDQDPRGFALHQDGRVTGHLPWHHQELVAALNHLDALARSPRALAAVLEAAGASALQRVGALLARRSA
jgi:hypothetical protein